MNSRYRDIVRDSLQEYVRKNNFIRIYPSKNSDLYDQYFITPRPSNKMLHKYLFSDEIISHPYGYPTNNLQTNNENSKIQCSHLIQNHILAPI